MQGVSDPVPKSKAPAQTFEEPKYLRELVENRTPIHIKLISDEDVEGVIEYWDADFLRLTRTDEPNLFIYKEQIKYFYEMKG